MIRTGTLYYGAGSTPDWPLSDPIGAPREFVTPDVGFPTPFGRIPDVIVALSGIQSSGDVAVSVEATEIQKEEFNIKVIAHGDAVINGVWVTYLAYD